MKNQTDLITRIVAVVLALIACGVIYFNQPQPFQPSDPEQVPNVKMELPAGTVVRTPALPGASNNGQTGGGLAAGGSSSPAPSLGSGAPAGGGGGGGGGEISFGAANVSR